MRRPQASLILAAFLSTLQPRARAGIITEAPFVPEKFTIVEVTGNLLVPPPNPNTDFSRSLVAVYEANSNIGGGMTEQPPRISREFYFGSTRPIERVWHFFYPFTEYVEDPLFAPNLDRQRHDLRDLPEADFIQMQAFEFRQVDGVWEQRWTYTADDGDPEEVWVRTVPEPAAAALALLGVVLLAWRGRLR